jgi:Rrf2 family transcriptional regulator, cysteine metabolism repressor
MTQLSRSYDVGLLSLAEISRAEQLPLAYLEQLVGELRRAGLVEGTRGLHGGYRLSRPPGDITVGEIYRVLEGPIAPVECTAEDYLPGSCAVEDGCLSRSVWARVQDSVNQVLDSTTLASLGDDWGPASAPGSLIALGAFSTISNKKECGITP